MTMTPADKTKLQKRLNTIVQGRGTLQMAGKRTAPSDLLPRLECLEEHWLASTLEHLDGIIGDMQGRALPTTDIPDNEGRLPTVNFTIDDDCNVSIDTSWPR